jgi:hypothetical protein
MSNEQIANSSSGNVEKKPGWIKWLLIGCVTLVLLAMLSVIGCFLAAKYFVHKVVNVTIEAVENQLLDQYPAGSQEREDIKKTFRNGAEALKKGNLSGTEMKRIGDLISEANKDRNVDTGELSTILKYVNEAVQDKSDAEIP